MHLVSRLEDDQEDASEGVPSPKEQAIVKEQREPISIHTPNFISMILQMHTQQQRRRTNLRKR